MALGVGAVLVVIAGANPIQAYQSLIIAAFGSTHAISEVLVKSATLILASLAVSVAYKVKFINLGAEGQLSLGALAALIVGLNFSGLNPFLLFPLIGIASFLAGVAMIAIPAVLKSKFGVNEVITTLMMNYVSFWLIAYLVSGPFKSPQSELPVTSILDVSARFIKIWPGTRLHLGFVITIVFVPLIYLLLYKFSLSYKIRAVGESEKAARYGGINVPRTLLITAIISGGLAGLAGMNETIGINHYLPQNFTPGFGWNAIIVALIGGLRPINVTIAAILFSAMITGAETMQRTAAVPSPLVSIIQALLVIFVLGSKFLIKKKVI